MRTPRQHRGYICVWGTSPKEEVVDAQGLEMDCPRCDRHARMIGKKVSRYCTVFYIPLFPEGEAQEFFECSLCGGQFQGSLQELRQRLAGARREQEEQLAVANKRFVEHPEDLDNTCELLKLLAAAGRVDEGIETGEKAVAQNPEHANLSIILGRLYLTADRKAEALATFDRAVEANPQHAGARFFKAVALVQGEEPDVEAALEEARRAHDLGYPEALSLLRTLEEQVKQSA